MEMMGIGEQIKVEQVHKELDLVMELEVGNQIIILELLRGIICMLNQVHLTFHQKNLFFGHLHII